MIDESIQETKHKSTDESPSLETNLASELPILHDPLNCYVDNVGMSVRIETSDPCVNVAPPQTENGIETHVITSIEQFITLTVDINYKFGCNPWWRGHAKTAWKVIPSIFHQGKENTEGSMTNRFRVRGGVLIPNAPQLDDTAGWLFLMQHHGLPTRLLDWSESPLVALFFVVREENHHNSDGTIWALNAAKLNKDQIGTALLPGPTNKLSSGLFKEAYSLDTCTSEDKVIAIHTEHKHLRQFMQASEFTIHGSKKPLEEYVNATNYMIRINVPQSMKAKLKLELKLLNINELALFPDLDHLAKELSTQIFVEET